MKGFEKRYLFKRAFAQLLPAEIIRKKKHGFGIPVAFWIKSDPLLRELASDTLLSSRAQPRPYLQVWPCFTSARLNPALMLPQ